MTHNELKELLRQSDLASDPWGTSLSAHFAVCDELLYRGAHIPAHWGFKPGACHIPARDMDDPYTADFMTCSDETLITFGNLLHRYTRYAEYHGKGY